MPQDLLNDWVNDSEVVSAVEAFVLHSALGFKDRVTYINVLLQPFEVTCRVTVHPWNSDWFFKKGDDERVFHH